MSGREVGGVEFDDATPELKASVEFSVEKVILSCEAGREPSDSREGRAKTNGGLEPEPDTISAGVEEEGVFSTEEDRGAFKVAQIDIVV